MDGTTADNGHGLPPQGAPHAGVDGLARSAHQAVDRIAGAAGQLADTLVARSEPLKRAPARLGESVRSQVRAHPLATVGLAVAVGFALSRLMRVR